MKFGRTISAIRDQRDGTGCVITIGTYDGVHLGHQSIIRQVVDKARKDNVASTLMCFEPTPKEFFRPDEPPGRLTRFREKFQILKSLEIDELFCPRFNPAMRNMSPDAFIEDFLLDGLGVQHVVVGDDFRYGARAAGNVEHLRRLSEQHGFDVTVVPPVDIDGRRVSSSAIRRAFEAGDLDTVRDMLGRHYSMSGPVIHGQQLGRTLGFPTANIPVKRRKTATSGIFAVRVHGLDEGVLDGVASLGTRPTVTGDGDGDGEMLLEVFIFDFDRFIYGEYLEVDLIAKLRDEEKYPNLDVLVEQMHRDVQNAKQALAQNPG
ncbi:MAG: bifunctional riboflavin kinase/FAD synthetase [Pseudomonadota bacterium]